MVASNGDISMKMLLTSIGMSIGMFRSGFQAAEMTCVK